MTIDRETMADLARLARLELSEIEAESLSGDLERILRYVSTLDELLLPPSLPVREEHGLIERLREDTTGRTLTIDEALANAPSAEDGHFTVPAVVRPEPTEDPEEA